MPNPDGYSVRTGDMGNSLYRPRYQVLPMCQEAHNELANPSLALESRADAMRTALRTQLLSDRGIRPQGNVALFGVQVEFAQWPSGARVKQLYRQETTLQNDLHCVIRITQLLTRSI